MVLGPPESKLGLGLTLRGDGISGHLDTARCEAGTGRMDRKVRGCNASNCSEHETAREIYYTRVMASKQVAKYAGVRGNLLSSTSACTLPDTTPAKVTLSETTQ